VRVAELAEHGDLGLGTFNALDGEMIALDGRFYRADADGRTAEVDPDALSPFAVTVQFDPSVELSLDRPLGQAELLAALDGVLPADTAACALRVR
jgi:acetolactate decarboxylase